LRGLDSNSDCQRNRIWSENHS